jgi:hypothetical protein
MSAEPTPPLAVVIPAVFGSGPLGRVLPRSGIVARRLSHGKVEVYFEGNRYGAANLTTFEERVLCAAGRLTARYPTVAKAWCDLGDIEVVGVCYPDRGEVVIGRPERLEAWLAWDQLA